jgi:hypothetical protein
MPIVKQCQGWATAKETQSVIPSRKGALERVITVSKPALDQSFFKGGLQHFFSEQTKLYIKQSFHTLRW